MKNKYSIYYDMDSCKKYLDIDEAIESDDLKEAIRMLPFLLDRDDGLIIYVNKLMVQVMVRGHDEPSKCKLEIHDGRKGVCFSKEYIKAKLEEKIEADLMKYIESPLQYGFESESF